MTNPAGPSENASTRIAAAEVALSGLSLGDAFGQQFFSEAVWDTCLRERELPLPVWHFTDDTVMALSLYEVLREHGRVDQEALAAGLIRRYLQEPNRGYGAGAARLLREAGAGGDWRELRRCIYGGEGSYGNGAAMRVAPLGAYFADDFDRVVEQARLSAEVTHVHPEGVAGAIAVAVAAAWAHQNGSNTGPAEELLQTAVRLTPPSLVRDGIARAAQLPLDSWEHTAASALGNGSQLTAPDTVPFCLWCAAANLQSYDDAMWSAVRVRGDMDTNCAIVGGIDALAIGEKGLPKEWIRRREALMHA